MKREEIEERGAADLIIQQQEDLAELLFLPEFILALKDSDFCHFKGFCSAALQLPENRDLLPRYPPSLHLHLNTFAFLLQNDKKRNSERL